MQPDLPNIPYERWLTAKDVAAHFALCEKSAYRWRDEGRIPHRFVKFCGTHRLLFHPHVIPFLEEYFASLR